MNKREALMVTALASIALMVSATVASGAGPGVAGPIGSTITEEGRAPVHHGGSLPVEAGKNVLIQSFVVEPGQSTGWHTHPGAAFLMKRGNLTHYIGCDAHETWHEGTSAVHTPTEDSLGLLTNDGTEPAAFLAVFSAVDSTAPVGTSGFIPASAPAGCESERSEGVTFTEVGRGRAYGTGAFDVEAGKSIVIQRFLLEPGWTSGWHRHPDTNLVIQLDGTLVNHVSCKEKETWVPGNAYLHLNSEHHDAHANLTRNDSEQSAEIVAVFFNVLKEHPSPLTPLTPTPPPAECPTTG